MLAVKSRPLLRRHRFIARPVLVVALPTDVTSLVPDEVCAAWSTHAEVLTVLVVCVLRPVMLGRQSKRIHNRWERGWGRRFYFNRQSTTGPLQDLPAHHGPAAPKGSVCEGVVLPADVLFYKLLKVSLDPELLAKSVHGGEAIELGFREELTDLLEVALVTDEEGQEYRVNMHGGMCC